MNRISISIQYAGLTLPVVKNEAGTDCVPLKPLTELFGIEWMNQYKKIQDDWRQKFLGVCIGDITYAGEQSRQMVCIRLDRVAAYLMGLNPTKIRAAGNTSGADFLEAKLIEWADALHDYETFGVAHNPRHADALLALRRATAITKVSNIKDARLRSIALSELGIALDDISGAAPAGQSGELFPAA